MASLLSFAAPGTYFAYCTLDARAPIASHRLTDETIKYESNHWFRNRQSWFGCYAGRGHWLRLTGFPKPVPIR